MKSAEFSTPILTSVKNRMNNLKLCAKALSGVTIKQGEEFSFNKTVGPRTEEKGYKEAHVLIDGEEVDQTGGGICQVASTLYNAALMLDFDVVERNQHAEEVYYIELGKDATVYYGSLDLRLKNTLKHDVKIEVDVTDEKVTVKMNEITDTND